MYVRSKPYTRMHKKLELSWNKKRLLPGACKSLTTNTHTSRVPQKLTSLFYHSLTLSSFVSGKEHFDNIKVVISMWKTKSPVVDHKNAKPSNWGSYWMKTEAKAWHVSQKIISMRLQEMGKITKLDKWTREELQKRQAENRSQAASTSRKEIIFVSNGHEWQWIFIFRKNKEENRSFHLAKTVFQPQGQIASARRSLPQETVSTQRYGQQMI